MDENRENPVVSYAAFEAVVTDYQKIIRTILIGWLITIVLFSGCVYFALYYYSQYDYTDETWSDVYSQEGDGRFNLNIGEQGDVSYGQTDVSEDLSKKDNDATW